MATCPVCKEQITGFVCANCGFDRSTDYEQYPTLVSGISTKSTASLKSAYAAAHTSLVSQLDRAQTGDVSLLLRCQKCGNVSFGFLPASNTLICTECNSIFPGLVYSREYVEQLRSSIPVQPESKTTPDIPTFQAPLQPCRRFDAAQHHTLILQDNGCIQIIGQVEPKHRMELNNWRDIVSIAACPLHSVGLRKDGTVVTAGDERNGKCDVGSWKDIVAIAAGNFHTVGLCKDGTVVTVGNTAFGAGKVEEWQDIVAIAAISFGTVGLRRDGTVLLAGDPFQQCDISGWKDIVAISAKNRHVAGLRRDGTVVATGENSAGQCNVSSWKDIIAISAGGSHTLGLCKDGTIVTAGDNSDGQCNLSHRREVIAIAAGNSHSICLRKDGSLVAAGSNSHGQCKVSNIWISLDPH